MDAYPLQQCNMPSNHGKQTSGEGGGCHPVIQIGDDDSTYPQPDLHGCAGSYGLSRYHMGKYEGYHGILFPIKQPSPLCSQDYSKPVPHLPWGGGVPAS